ncbi:hypothetical protein K7432_006599 [Basidiobolus ranarum]|uniref:Uncharacterized protein n=1 Tax=Basidiobolus ranarum TaxID=34480 RepID=A0ABR2W1D4_9FUNG
MKWNQSLDEHLTNYGCLYTLQLLFNLFSREESKLRLQKAEVMCWGSQPQEEVDYWDPRKSKYKSFLYREIVTPREYIKRLVDECWQGIFSIGHADAKSSRRQGLWFLRQFCVIYGFSSIMLELRNPQMLEQLLQISLIDELKNILPKNRDTFTQLLKYHDQQQQHSHTADSGTHEWIDEEEDLDSVKSGSTETELFKTLNFLNDEYHISAKPREEDFFMNLMDHITRVSAPVFPVQVFSRILKSLPEIAQDEINFEPQLEILGCIEYLLHEVASDPVFGSTSSPKTWFRESPPRTDMVKIVNKGIRGYSERYRENGIDPRLIAAYLKHQINESNVPLVPIEFVDVLNELIPATEEDTGYVWHPSVTVMDLLRSMLRLSAWRWEIFVRIMDLVDVLMKDGMSTFAIAIIFPLQNPSTFNDWDEFKRWNWCWGCLLQRRVELFKQFSNC